MDLLQAKIDGTDILINSNSGILYTKKDRRKLAVSDESSDNDSADGRIVSATYASKRVITLEGVIDRLGNDGEQAAILHLENIFALHNTEEIDARTLYILDTLERERELQVKIAEPLDIQLYDDDRREAARKRRVVLESLEDPTYRSPDDFIYSGVEGEYGGIELECELECTLDDYFNIIEIESDGANKNPLKFVITATGTIDTPLTIRNLTDDTYFQMNISAVAGDVIEVDSQYFTIKKNGVLNNGARVVGSTRQFVKGALAFGFDDAEGALPDQDFTVDIYFKNSLL